MTHPAITAVILMNTREVFPQTVLADMASQTFSDFECLLIDDAPADAASDVRELPLPDARFRILHTGGIGETRARNLAMDNAMGEWILFFHPCCAILPHALARLYEAGEEAKADIVLCGHYRIQNGMYCAEPLPYDGEIPQKEVTRRLIMPLCCMEYRHGTRPLPSLYGAAGHGMYRLETLRERRIRFYGEEESPLLFDLHVLFGGGRPVCVRDCLMCLPDRHTDWLSYRKLHRAVWDDLRGQGMPKSEMRQYRAQLWYYARRFAADPACSAIQWKHILRDPILQLFCRHPDGLPFLRRWQARLFHPALAGFWRRVYRTRGTTEVSYETQS